MQAVPRPLVLGVGDVRDLVARRQVEALHVGERELRLAELLGERRVGELFAHPLVEVVARSEPAHARDRVEEPAGPLPADPAVGELRVLRVVQDPLQARGVVADREQRRDDRSRGRAGDVHPLADAAVLLRGCDRAREGDALDTAALEDSVCAMAFILRHANHLPSRSKSRRAARSITPRHERRSTPVWSIHVIAVVDRRGRRAHADRGCSRCPRATGSPASRASTCR